ncbi:helix-turn-helix domain-containing protein [Aquiluna sp. KACHI24]|uniref:helix-turn-helix domain-containing protein n=1 Tax=Aquiluna sp. KACHI24 TaxID=2968831 RepID=UPI00222FDC32|nr:helix-turn-helix domain-containing protein [Aquiluna sp. KACHI24]
MLRRFGSLTGSLGRRYLHLASSVDLIEREVETDFLLSREFTRAILPNAKSAIPVNLFIERAEMLISIPEAARDYLHVSKSTVYRLVEQGAIQVVHVRGSARIPIKSIEAYVDSLCGGYR